MCRTWLLLPLPLTRCQCSVAPLEVAKEVAPLEVAHMVVVPEVLVQAQGVDTVVVAVAPVEVAALRIDSRRRGSTTYALRIGSGAAVGGSPEAVT